MSRLLEVVFDGEGYAARLEGGTMRSATEAGMVRFLTDALDVPHLEAQRLCEAAVAAAS